MKLLLRELGMDWETNQKLALEGARELLFDENGLKKLPRVEELRAVLRHSMLGLFEVTDGRRNGVGRSLYTIPTVEYCDQLAKALKKLQGPKDRILEVCAGDGFLSYCLQQRGVKILPVDNRCTEESHNCGKDPRVEVAEAEAIEAIDDYKPTIVVASWIPYEDDLDERIVLNPHPKWLILIGEGCGGCTGSMGVWDYAHETMDEVDEYKGVHVNLCRTDHGGGMYHNRTAKFPCKGNPLFKEPTERSGGGEDAA
jgi:hypothetical protein